MKLLVMLVLSALPSACGRLVQTGGLATPIEFNGSFDRRPMPAPYFESIMAPAPACIDDGVRRGCWRYTWPTSISDGWTLAAPNIWHDGIHTQYGASVHPRPPLIDTLNPGGGFQYIDSGDRTKGVPDSTSLFINRCTAQDPALWCTRPAFEVYSATFGVSPGQSYNLSYCALPSYGFGSVAAPPSAGVTVSVVWLDGAGDEVGRGALPFQPNEVPLVSSGWKQVSLTLSAPGNAFNGRILVRVEKAERQVYIDEITLEPL